VLQTQIHNKVLRSPQLFIGQLIYKAENISSMIFHFKRANPAGTYIIELRTKEEARHYKRVRNQNHKYMMQLN